MKRIAPFVFLVWALTSTALIRAQYTLTPLAPPPAFSFNDLWHFTIVRSAGDANVQFYISLRIYNGTGQLLVKSNTAPFILDAGSRYFNSSNLSDLQPFASSFYDAGTLQQVIASGGNFPPATYHMIYTLFGKAKDGEFAPLVEGELETTVESMWPPMLLSPEDEEKITTRYPLLTWTPAFSSTATQPIVYDLYLVEMKPGQNPAQALKANPPLLQQRSIPVTMLSYPASAEALREGTHYAWYVTAKSGDGSLGQSQMWGFEIGKDPTPQAPDEPYVELFTVPAPYVYKAQFGKLRIKYVEEYILAGPDDHLQFKIYNWMGKVVYEHTALGTPIGIKKGHNYVEINVGSLAVSGVGGLGPYLLEVYNHKNEKQYVRFLIEGIVVK